MFDWAQRCVHYKQHTLKVTTINMTTITTMTMTTTTTTITMTTTMTTTLTTTTTTNKARRPVGLLWGGVGVLVVVTHQVNITALAGIYPASGEAVVLRAANGELQVLGRLTPE